MKTLKQISRLLLVLVLLITSVLVVSSCSAGGVGKVKESSINYDGKTITWGAADNATSYTVSINGAEFVTTITTYGYTAKTDDQTVTVTITPMGKKGKAGDPVSKVFSRLDEVTNLQFDEEGVLTWDAVNGASAYVVSVNGQEFTVGECRYADFEPGKQTTVKVKASSTTNNTFSFYNDKNTVTAFFLPAPTDITYDGSTINWKGSSKASGYEIYVNGSLVNAEKVTSSSYQYNASGCDFDLQVLAVGNPASNIFASDLSIAESYHYLDQIVKYDLDAGVLSWEPVENANGYQLYVNNTLVNLTENKYTNLYTGRSNTVKILPVGGDTSEHVHYFSDWSEEWNIFILNYPVTNWNQALVPDNGVATNNFGWQPVDGEIEGYEVKVVLPDGSVETYPCGELTNAFSYAFEAVGNYTISVRTIADKSVGDGYYDSSFSPEIVVVRLAAPNRASEFIVSESNNVTAGFTAFIQNDSQASGYQVWREGVKITGFSETNNGSGGNRSIKITDIYDPTVFTEQQIHFSIQSLGGIKTSGNQTIVTLPSNTDNSLEFTITVLAVPQQLNIDGDIMSWASVVGANGYYVTGDGGDDAPIAQYSLKNLTVGSHELRVCSVGNGKEILPSPYSVALKAHKLAAPTDIRIGQTGVDEGKLLFTRVEYASSYELIIDSSTTPVAAEEFDNVYKNITTAGTSIVMVAVGNYYNEGNQTHYISSNYSDVLRVFRLAAPTFNYPISFVGTELVWNAPFNTNAAVYAPSYEMFDAASNYYYDGLINATKKDLSNFSSGTYEFKVRAIGDGTSCINSEWSEITVVDILESPTITWSDDLKGYTFTAVPLAQHYVIAIQGRVVYTADANGYSSTGFEGNSKPFYYVPTAFENIGNYEITITATSDSAISSPKTVNSTINQRVEQLAKPQYTLGYTEECYSSTGKVYIQLTAPVANASGYNYFIGGATINNSTETYCDYNTGATGKFACGVQALGGMFDAAGVYYISSDIAGNNASSTINVLGTPTNATASNTTLSWASIDGSLKYKVVLTFQDGTVEEYEPTTARVSIANQVASGNNLVSATIQAIGNGVTSINGQVYTYYR